MPTFLSLIGRLLIWTVSAMVVSVIGPKSHAAQTAVFEPASGVLKIPSLALGSAIYPKTGIYPVAGNASGGLKVPSVGAIFSLT